MDIFKDQKSSRVLRLVQNESGLQGVFLENQMERRFQCVKYNHSACLKYVMFWNTRKM